MADLKVLIPTLFSKKPLLNLQINRPPALHKLTGETMTLNYWAVSFIGRLRIVRFFDGQGTTPYTNESRVRLIRFRNFARGRSTESIAPAGMRGATSSLPPRAAAAAAARPGPSL